MSHSEKFLDEAVQHMLKVTQHGAAPGAKSDVYSCLVADGDITVATKAERSTDGGGVASC